LFSRRSFVAAGLLAPLARPAAAVARYPAHSVTVVNPFAAGGQSDPIGRIVNAHFQNALGQPFLMENRAGAGRTIGGQYVVRSAPDGYTLLLGTTSTFTIAPVLVSALSVAAPLRWPSASRRKPRSTRVSSRADRSSCSDMRLARFATDHSASGNIPNPSFCE